MSKLENDAIVNEEELAVAEKEAGKSKQVHTHKFNKPFEYQGKTYEDFTFDWGKLTGKDGLDIENELQQIGKPAIVPAFSGEYLIRLAAKACTTPIGADAFENMPIADYNKIRSAARSFLLSSES